MENMFITEKLRHVSKISQGQGREIQQNMSEVSRWPKVSHFLFEPH